MADAEDTIDLGLIVIILVAVGVGIYFIYKAVGGLGDGVAKFFGLQGAKCVVSAITCPGQVTTAQSNAIKSCLENTFPGVDKSVVDANVDTDVAITNKNNVNGPNAFQVAFNYWFGTKYGYACAPQATSSGSIGATLGLSCTSCNSQAQQDCAPGICSGCCGDGSLD